MASQEILEDPQEEPFNNSKIWIFKVSIHCEGCKRKVKKILSQVEGVHETEIDAKQQKVTVTGNVDADTLLRKLNKSGKHAELWPESPDQKEKKSAKPTKKEKVVVSQQEASASQSVVNVNNNVITNVKEVKRSTVKANVAAQVPRKDSHDGGADNSSVGEGGRAGTVGGVAKTAGVEESVAVGNSKTSGGDATAKESNKSEGRKPESGSGGAQPTTASAASASAEEKGGESDKNKGSSIVVGKVSGGNDSGSGGKKKKSKGQKGNNSVTEQQQQSSVPARTEGSRDHGDGTPNIPFSDHHSGPRHPFYDYHYPPPQFYGPPPPAPVYATVSYHTAYPTGSYTASYYPTQPPNSYVYAHPGGTEVQSAPSDFGTYSVRQPLDSLETPPSNFDTYSSRQPLDSFEMFSDENPNGCSIM